MRAEPKLLAGTQYEDISTYWLADRLQLGNSRTKRHHGHLDTATPHPRLTAAPSCGG